MIAAVLYHADCPDGWTAAWVAHSTLWHEASRVELFAVSHGKPPPDLTGYNEVYILDFSYPHDILVEMAKGRLVVVLDHHRSAMDDLMRGALQQPDLPPWPGTTYRIGPEVAGYHAQFDTERSGAGITWDYFNASKRPPLVDYVEDRDLWRYALPHSKAVTAYIASRPRTLDAWDDLAATSVDEVISAGAAIVDRIDLYCASAAQYAYWCTMGDRTFPIVNVTHDAGSDVCNHLLDLFETDMAGYFFELPDGRWQYGFRSRGDVTVHDHAVAFGGGGHPHASGCETPEITHKRTVAP